MPKARDGKLVVGYMGVLAPHKGVDVLADAARLMGPNSNVRFLIGGTGEDEAYVAALTSKIKSNIAYSGSTDMPGNPRAVFFLRQWRRFINGVFHRAVIRRQSATFYLSDRNNFPSWQLLDLEHGARVARHVRAAAIREVALDLARQGSDIATVLAWRRRFRGRARRTRADRARDAAHFGGV